MMVMCTDIQWKLCWGMGIKRSKNFEGSVWVFMKWSCDRFSWLNCFIKVSNILFCLPEQKQLIILGHFGLQPDTTEFNLLRENHFQHCVPSDTFTNISSKNKTGDDCQDNIWWNQPAQGAYTGSRSSSVTDHASGCLLPIYCPVWFPCRSHSGHWPVDGLLHIWGSVVTETLKAWLLQPVHGLDRINRKSVKCGQIGLAQMD